MDFKTIAKLFGWVAAGFTGGYMFVIETAMMLGIAMLFACIAGVFYGLAKGQEHVNQNYA